MCDQRTLRQLKIPRLRILTGALHSKSVNGVGLPVDFLTRCLRSRWLGRAPIGNARVSLRGRVAAVGQYGGAYVDCDLNNDKEIALRSPIVWLQCVKSPVYVFERAENGSRDAIQLMVDENVNPRIQFFKVPWHDHFSVIAPLTEKLADPIVKGKINVTKQNLQRLR